LLQEIEKRCIKYCNADTAGQLESQKLIGDLNRLSERIEAKSGVGSGWFALMRSMSEIGVKLNWRTEVNEMYWIWENSIDENELNAMIYGVPEALKMLREFGIRFDDGNHINAEVPKIIIERDGDSQGHLNDNLVAPGTSGLLFSAKLRSVLANCGVDNIEYFPVTIHNPQDGSSSQEYYLANIVGRIACVDLAGSDVQMHPNFPDEIEFMDSLKLDESLINGVLIFRLFEHSQVIIAHEKIKNACELSGITGVKFTLPQAFSR